MTNNNFITIYTAGNPVNKQAILNTDNSITKRQGTTFYSGWGVKKHCPDIESLKAELEKISESPNQCFALGFHLEVEKNVPYLIKSIPDIDNDQFTPIEGKPGYYTDNTGTIITTRTKALMAPSSYIMLDKDDDHPDKPNQSFEKWEVTLDIIMPGFRDAKKIVKPSNSSRLGLCAPDKKYHVFIKVKDPNDILNLKHRLLSTANAAGLGFIKMSKDDKHLSRTIVDAEVFSPERLIYDGRPTTFNSDGDDISAILAPADIKLLPGNGKDKPVDTSLIKMMGDDKAKFKTKYVDTPNGKVKTTTYRHNDNTKMKLDDPITIKHRGADGQHIIVTPRELHEHPEYYDLYDDNGTGKIRSQSTYDDRGSISFNGVIRRGKQGMPQVYDHGGDITYVLNDADIGSLIGLGQTALPAGVTPVVEGASNTFEEFVRRSQYVHTESTGSHFDNARDIYVYQLEGKVIICHEEFYYWTGTHHELVPKSLMKAHIGQVLQMTKRSMTNINGTVTALGLVVPSISSMNPPCKKIYFLNGYVDFSKPTPVLKPHEVSNYNTSVMDFNYDPDAMPPGAFFNFLHSIFEGDPDILDKFLMIQEVMGWPMISDNLGIEKGVALVGAKRAGKGIILRILQDVMGADNTNIISGLGDLSNDKVLSSSINKNLTIDYDARKIPVKDINQTEGVILKLTSNEPMSVQILYVQKPITGCLNTKLYFACNEMPNMIDDSGAINNRIEQLTFNNSFLGRENPDLFNIIIAEKQLIGNWMIEGLQRLIKNRRFTRPASSLDALNSAAESSQPLTLFIEENLILGDTEIHRVHGDVLYRLWRTHCMENNTKCGSAIQFKKSIETNLRHKGVRYGQVKIDGTNKHGFYGISVKPVVYVPPPVMPVEMEVKVH